MLKQISMRTHINSSKARSIKKQAIQLSERHKCQVSTISTKRQLYILGPYLLWKVVNTSADDDIVLEAKQGCYSLRNPSLHHIHVDFLHVDLQRNAVAQHDEMGKTAKTMVSSRATPVLTYVRHFKRMLVLFNVECIVPEDFINNSGTNIVKETWKW